MELLNKMTVTDIEEITVVHSAKGRVFNMKNRPTYGLSFCTSGQITYTMNGKEYVSNPNNAVILPQGGTYSLYGDSEGFFPLVNFKCENFSINEISVIELKEPQECLRQIESLKDLFFRSEDRLKMYGAFYTLLSEIALGTSKSRNPLGSVIQYIDEHLADSELSNVKLAKTIGISEVYLRKLFITNQNCTPKQYILNMRIQKAKKLLVDTPHSVTQIAEECGFGSLYHFCRAFKEKTGSTPTEYAKLNKVYLI